MEYRHAAHLLRRMGFGGPPEQIQALAALSREAAVDQLLNIEAVNKNPMEKALKRMIRNSVDFDIARRWWFARMIMTGTPFEEKMTLFWHNHFATSDQKAFALTVPYQVLTLRDLGLGKFDDLLLAVVRDPAMLIWLDNLFSTKDRPNENLARECMELFTTGINGPDGPNYTEADVKEVARAFTGWSIRSLRTLITFNPKKSDPYGFNFQEPQHDHGTKTIFGLAPADLDGTDVVRILAARPATARFLTKKLFAFFVFPLNDGDPSDQAIIEEFAQVYLNNDHSIKALVSAIFKSDLFFSDRALFALVKNPVEYVVGAIRMLAANYNDSGSGFSSPASLHQVAARMGLNIYRPEDVSGWKLGLSWIGTSTVLERYNFANALMSNRTGDATQPAPFVSNDQLKQHVKSNAADTVAGFLNLLGPVETSQDTVARLVNYLETDEGGGAVTFTPDDATINRKIRGLVRHIMCLPEFQLN